jgi:SAM-dependent methyltransferase
MESLTSHRQWTDYHHREADKYQSHLESAVENWRYNATVFYAIKKLLSPPARILEVGTGHGYAAIYLHGCGYEVTGIDNHEEALQMARQNARRFGVDLSLEQGDAADLGKYHGRFDLVFSLGLIEHFETDLTVKLLKEQARCARYVLSVIPTRHTLACHPYMDEKHYGPHGLRSLYKKAGLKVTRLWGYGDVPLTWARVLRFGLPPLLHRFLAGHLSLTMSLACIGIAGGITRRQT